METTHQDDEDVYQEGVQAPGSGELIEITDSMRPYGIEQGTFMTIQLFDEAVVEYERYGVAKDRRLSQIGRAFSEAASSSTGKKVVFSIPTLLQGRRVMYRIQADVGQNPDGSGCITLKKAFT
jgi:hypothetical protein